MLGKTWGWSEDGGFSYVNKQMASQFASNEGVHVSYLVPHTNTDLHAEAKNCSVDLVGARCLNGFSTLDCLSFPPASVVGVDAIISYGMNVGKHAQPIKFRFTSSKWVHIVCSSSKSDDSIILSEFSDLTLAIGSDLAGECKRRLAFCEKKVIGFIPSIFQDCQLYRQVTEERPNFSVVTFYPPDTELSTGEESYIIPAKAVGMLDDKYHLIAVCAPSSEPDEVNKMLTQQHEMPANQLKTRCHCKDLKSLCKIFVEADLLILPFLPFKEDGFGFIALQAISVALPVLVSYNTGLGKALVGVLHGDLFVVDSDKPEVWKNYIIRVKKRERAQRLSEAKELRENYGKKYPWEHQCEAVLDEILKLH